MAEHKIIKKMSQWLKAVIQNVELILELSGSVRAGTVVRLLEFYLMWLTGTASAVETCPHVCQGAHHHRIGVTLHRIESLHAQARVNIYILSFQSCISTSRNMSTWQ